MTRRNLLLAAGAGVLLIAVAVAGTLWILRQPIAPASEAEIDEYAPVSSANEAPVDPTEPASEGHVRIALFVLASDGETLAAETQEVPQERSVQLQAKQVVQLLLRRSAAIPSGVELRELFITSQGIAYVDLSSELVANHPGGSSAEELTIFSLTHTLVSNFPEIRLVKILVEGREVQSLAGHLDLTVPYGRAPDYLRPEAESAEARSSSRNEAG